MAGWAVWGRSALNSWVESICYLLMNALDDFVKAYTRSPFGAHLALPTVQYSYHHTDGDTASCV